MTDEQIGQLLALLLLLAPWAGFASEGAVRRLRGLSRQMPASYAIGLAALLLPYAAFGYWTGGLGAAGVDPAWLRGLGILAAFLAAAGVAAAVVQRVGERRVASWGDLLPILCLWLPFDFRLLQGIWVVEAGDRSYLFTALLAVDAALLTFLVFRELDGIGFRLGAGEAASYGGMPGAAGLGGGGSGFGSGDLHRAGGVHRGGGASGPAGVLRTAVVNFLLFALIAIPLGLAIGFIGIDPEFAPVDFAVSFLGILLFVAIPEELLFRGLLQNLLGRLLGNAGVALVLAAVVFGAAHLNNNAAPNWPYFLMASIAGLFYGRAWLASGTLAAPVLVHTLVDSVWRAFFDI